MALKTVRVDVDERIPRVPFENLKPLQGELKSLSPESEAKLWNSILNRGFFAPMFVWVKGKSTVILDGHQRQIVLTKMKENGYTIPKIPCVMIHAKSEKEAKEKLLLISSNFGKVQKDGLYTFLQGIDETLLVTSFELPELDTLKFMDQFYPAGRDNVVEPLEPLPAVTGDLRSIGGNGIKMLQLFLTEEQHMEVLQLLTYFQDKHKTQNATDTILKVLRDARKKN